MVRRPKTTHQGQKPVDRGQRGSFLHARLSCLSLYHPAKYMPCRVCAGSPSASPNIMYTSIQGGLQQIFFFNGWVAGAKKKKRVRADRRRLLRGGRCNFSLYFTLYMRRLSGCFGRSLADLRSQAYNTSNRVSAGSMLSLPIHMFSAAFTR